MMKHIIRFLAVSLCLALLGGCVATAPIKVATKTTKLGVKTATTGVKTTAKVAGAVVLPNGNGQEIPEQ